MPDVEMQECDGCKKMVPLELNQNHKVEVRIDRGAEGLTLREPFRLCPECMKPDALQAFDEKVKTNMRQYEAGGIDTTPGAVFR